MSSFAFDDYEAPSAKAVVKKPLSKAKAPLSAAASSTASATAAPTAPSALPCPPAAVPVARAPSDTAFLYDEVFDTDLAAAKAEARRGFGGEALGADPRHHPAHEKAKFAASIAAAAQQRQLDHDDAVVDKHRAERAAERGDADLARIDREVGVFVTAGYKARMAARARRRGGDDDEEDDAAMQVAGGRRVPSSATQTAVFASRAARRTGGDAAAAATASALPTTAAPVSSADEDDAYYAAMDDTAAGIDAAVEPIVAARSPLLAGSGNTASVQALDAGRAADLPAGADISNPAEAEPAGETATVSLPGVETRNARPAAEAYEEAMAELDAARAARRKERARQRMAPSVLEAAVQLFLRRQAECDEALAREAAA